MSGQDYDEPLQQPPIFYLGMFLGHRLPPQFLF
jgi:hypothetical protein